VTELLARFGKHLSPLVIDHYASLNHCLGQGTHACRQCWNHHRRHEGNANADQHCWHPRTPKALNDIVKQCHGSVPPTHKDMKIYTLISLASSYLPHLVIHLDSHMTTHL